MASESDNWSRPDWWDHAACRGRHDLLDAFVPAGFDNPKRASPKASSEILALCEGCPVRIKCYVTGFFDRYAIRGGMTAAQRDAVMRKVRRDARAS